jgi:hypothetical protein
MSRWKRFVRQLPLLVVVLVAGVAIAQTATTGRVFPYVGYLEEDGFPVDGVRYVRINLHPLAVGGTTCDVQDFPSTTVAAGRFQVDVADVPDGCLIGGELFASVAVGADVGSLVNLSTGVGAGRVRIGAVPFAAASAKAATLLVEDDARVGGSLTVVGNTTTSTLDVTSNTTAALDVTGNAEVGSLNAIANATVGNDLFVTQGARFDCNSCGSDTTFDGFSDYGTLTVQGRVISTDDNLHLSPPGGSNVYINDQFRAAGGGTTGDVGLVVDGRISGKMFGGYDSPLVFGASYTVGDNDGFLVGTARRDSAGGHCYLVVSIGSTTFNLSSRVEAGVADINFNFPIPAGSTFSVVNSSNTCSSAQIYFVHFGR